MNVFDYIKYSALLGFRALIKLISHARQKTVNSIINRKIHGCLEIPHLFLVWNMIFHSRLLSINSILLLFLCFVSLVFWSWIINKSFKKKNHSLFIHNSWVNLNIELAPENALLPLLTAFVQGNTQGELDPIGKGEVMGETVHFHSAYAKKCCVVLHSSSIYTSLISFTTEHSADFPNRYRRLRIQWFQDGGCS